MYQFVNQDVLTIRPTIQREIGTKKYQVNFPKLRELAIISAVLTVSILQNFSLPSLSSSFDMLSWIV